jgi:integrase
MLKRHLGDLPVNLLGREQVERYTADRRVAGAGGAPAKYRKTVRPLSNGTLIRELGVLRRAFAWAVDERWIASAPHVERPPAPPARERWLTEDEAQRLLESSPTPHVRLFIAVALWTAARTGAILELTWERIDFERGVINLGRGRGRKRRAVVPVVDDLLPLLREAREAATSPFVIEFGGSRVGSVKKAFQRATERAGLEGVTAHCLRHTSATWMVQKGVPTAMVARFLGNTEAMVEAVYGHHSPEYLRQAANALNFRKSVA